MGCVAAAGGGFTSRRLVGGRQHCHTQEEAPYQRDGDLKSGRHHPCATRHEHDCSVRRGFRRGRRCQQQPAWRATEKQRGEQGRRGRAAAIQRHPAAQQCIERRQWYVKWVDVGIKVLGVCWLIMNNSASADSLRSIRAWCVVTLATHRHHHPPRTPLAPWVPCPRRIEWRCQFARAPS